MIPTRRASARRERPTERWRDLKPHLDRLYANFNRAGEVPDPVEFVRPYDRPEDREVAAFLAAGLAFGRVASVNQSVARVLDLLGPHPAHTIADEAPRRLAARLDGFVHRWTRGSDLAQVLGVLRHMLRERGSIEGWFVQGWSEADVDVRPALESFGTRAMAIACAEAGAASARGAGYFFPRPSGGSACKRLNLFLRWMVRRDNLDPGGWTRVRPSQLIVPLDTHIIRLGRCLELTTSTTPGWRMAAEITAALRTIDPEDPVKYDFALCHLGMQSACGFNQPQGDAACPLRGFCRPAPRTRRASRPPSGSR